MMRTRILCAFVLTCVAACLTVWADPLNWSDKPVFTSEASAGSRQYPMTYRIEVWKDGSAELKVTPKIDMPEDQLPHHGEMTINDKTYQMAQRKDRDGKICLYGSLPVGSFRLDADLEFTMIAYNANGVKVAGDWYLQEMP